MRYAAQRQVMQRAHQIRKSLNLSKSESLKLAWKEYKSKEVIVMTEVKKEKTMYDKIIDSLTAAINTELSHLEGSEKQISFATDLVKRAKLDLAQAVNDVQAIIDFKEGKLERRPEPKAHIMIMHTLHKFASLSCKRDLKPEEIESFDLITKAIRKLFTFSSAKVLIDKLQHHDISNLLRHRIDQIQKAQEQKAA